MHESVTDRTGRRPSGWRVSNPIRKALKVAAVQDDVNMEDLVEAILAREMRRRGFLAPAAPAPSPSTR